MMRPTAAIDPCDANHQPFTQRLSRVIADDPFSGSTQRHSPMATSARCSMAILNTSDVSLFRTHCAKSCRAQGDGTCA